MENSTNQKIKEECMSAEDVAAVLSRVIKDVSARKVTLRYALAVSRLALALSKTIETVDLKKRVEFIEQMLRQQRK